MERTFLGIDFGTSGARAIATDRDGIIQAQASYPFGDRGNDPLLWKEALYTLIGKIPPSVRCHIGGIVINGTSATVLLCDGKGRPVTSPMMYNDSRAGVMVDKLREIAPPNHVVLSATSSLAKLLWWYEQPFYSEGVFFLHQADWLAFLLHGKLGISDYHNALKLGYDCENFCYPDWITNLPIQPVLPDILAPGMAVGDLLPEVANRFGMIPRCLVCAGTTDSIAAFVASGARKPGEAVTSLGSTLVLKLLSETKVEDSRYGIYSHRYGDFWLTGGASNTGGAVLRYFFTDEELELLSLEIDSQQESSLDYYPLLGKGDRFPINDPELAPRLTPNPYNRVEFLHGLLESMARIESKGYQLLQELGATKLTWVYTAGGGAKNETWREIRERRLKVPVVKPAYTEAAYGSCVLASGTFFTM